MLSINVMVKKATSISCFDFSNLYTEIRHDKIFTVCNEMTGFCVKVKDGEFISADDHGTK